MRGSLHHLELWVRDLDAALPPWQWLLGELGYAPYQQFPGGRSFRLGDDTGPYVVLEQSPALTGDRHERTRPGWNHVALWGGSPDDVDRLAAEAPARGWSLLFADRHPHAGGPAHYAAYLQDPDGHEVELVACRASENRRTQSPGSTSASPAGTNPSEA